MKTAEEAINHIIRDLVLLKDLIPQEEKPQWGIIEVGGLKFADANLGTDMDNPYGKYYTWDKAMKACPNGWYLPTQDEWGKFIENTTHEWVEDKEAINGMKFTDKLTGKSIFLSGMGWNNPIKRDIVNYVGGYAYYWSSSRHSSAYCSYNFYNLYFDCNGNLNPSSNTNRSFSTDRHYGFPVRCVQDIENEK